MDMMCLTGWYYQAGDGEDPARDFFETLRDRHAPFPFPCRYQVGFRKSGAESHGAEKRVTRTTDPTLETTLRSHFGNYYECIETFGADGSTG